MTLDAYMAVGPLDSKITPTPSPATARDRGEPKFLPIDVSEAIAQRHPVYESEEIPGSTFGSAPARPDDKIETVGVNHLIVARRELSDTAVGTFTRQLFAVRPVAGKGTAGGGQHRDARHRQGCRAAGASWCRGLYRRDRANLPRKIQRLYLGPGGAVVGPRIGGRVVSQLSQTRRKSRWHCAAGPGDRAHHPGAAWKFDRRTARHAARGRPHSPRDPAFIR